MPGQFSVEINSLIPNSDGTWRIPHDITKAEQRLIEKVTSYLTVMPAFESSRLLKEFFDTLKSNGLITNDEMRAHADRISDLVLLFAVSALHNCVVQIGDGSKTQLKAVTNMRDNTIDVCAYVPDPTGNHPPVSFACAMFSANLPPTAYCHPELLALSPWDCEIEVNREGILERLA